MKISQAVPLVLFLAATPSPASAQQAFSGGGAGGGATSTATANEAVNAGNAAYQRQDYANAVRYYAQACDLNSVSACSALGDMYLKGQGVARSSKPAAAPLAKACDGGIVASCGKLAELYERGDGIAVNKARAFNLYNGACAQSDVASCYNLGRMYEQGQGTSVNLAQAAALYQKACNAGIADGCTNIGAMYGRGAYFAQNEKQAEAFYRQGCNKGSAKGCSAAKQIANNRRWVAESSTQKPTSSQTKPLGNTGKKSSRYAFSTSPDEYPSKSLAELEEKCRKNTDNWFYSYDCGPRDRARYRIKIEAIPSAIGATTLEQRNLCIFTESVYVRTEYYKTGQMGIDKYGDGAEEIASRPVFRNIFINQCKFDLPVKCDYKEPTIFIKVGYEIDFCESVQVQ